MTPRNIKSGFRVTGIAPYDPDALSDLDFVQAEVNGENERAVLETEEEEEELQRRIIVTAAPEVGKKMSSSYTLSSAKKINRGRRRMSSNILTSPEHGIDLREKEEKQKPRSSAPIKAPKKIKPKKQ